MPVWMYRKGEGRIFPSPEDVPAGEGWQDTPVDKPVAEAPAATEFDGPITDELPPSELPDDEKEYLRERLHSLGVRVDGRWSIDRLREEIAKETKQHDDSA